MKKQILPYLCLSLILTPFFAFAETLPVKHISGIPFNAPSMQKSFSFEDCKETALFHKEKIMAPALRTYVQESEAVTESAKSSFEKISWYINSSYQSNSRKILNEKNTAMVPVKAKVSLARNSAMTTYQAEISLCNLSYQQASTTPKGVIKNTKS